MNKKKIFKVVLVAIGLFAIQFLLSFIKGKYFADRLLEGTTLLVVSYIVASIIGFVVAFDKASKKTWKWTMSFCVALAIGAISVVGLNLGENIVKANFINQVNNTNPSSTPPSNDSNIGIGADNGTKEVNGESQKPKDENIEEKSGNYFSDSSESTDNTDNQEKLKDNISSSSNVNPVKIITQFVAFFLLAFVGNYSGYKLKPDSKL